MSVVRGFATMMKSQDPILRAMHERNLKIFNI
jgi:hypothetical protein